MLRSNVRRAESICLLIITMVATVAADLPAQAPSPESIARQRFNQVFVKVILPVSSHTPKQDGPFIESWVAEQLKQLNVPEYFAVTNWVPVCDGLLADDDIDNDIWGGGRIGKVLYCPVGGDIPERKNGRLLVSIYGWTPGGVTANITLLDEPGSRAVEPVQLLVGGKPVKTEERLPYVAVMIAPPPLKKFKSITNK